MSAGDQPLAGPGPGRSGGLMDLGLRLVSAVVLAALALGALWAGGWLFAAFWLVAGVAIVWEWQHLVGGQALNLRLVVGAATIAVSAGLASLGQGEVGLALVMACSLLCAWLAGRDKALWSGVGVFYAGALVVSVCLLRNSLFHGAAAILWLFAVVWGTDIMAYFGGRLIGGPKLWPRVSPGKTWSGFCVGVVSGAAAGCAVALYATTPGELSLLPLVVLGLLAAMVSQGGDLFESAIKRRFGAKDSGRVIPGHGGVMDRLDGFIFAAAFAALIGTAHKGAVAAAHGLLVW